MEKQDERIKELESMLDTQSAKLIDMEEAYRVKLKETDAKESALRTVLGDSEQRVKFLTKELDEKSNAMKDLEIQMNRLTCESNEQQKEIADLKQRVKELRKKAERGYEERPAMEGGSSKLQDAHATLPEEGEANIHKILQRNPVEVDYQRESSKTDEVIEFKGNQHGLEPNNVFTDTAKTPSVLEDVAKLLHLFKPAKVLIEGHASTFDDKLDILSYTVARNRAEAVANEIGAFGVDTSCLSVAGPSGVNRVVMKVVEM